VTRENDPGWSDLVDGIIKGFYLAEKAGVTQATADDLLELFASLPTYAKQMRDIVEEFGNFEELWQRHFELLFPRGGLNELHVDHDTGLLYSLPLGNLESLGPGPVKGGTLEAIMERGVLRCGVTAKTAAFAEFDSETELWSGFDVEFCHALAAALFIDPEKLEISSIPAREQFAALTNGSIDVVAGTRVTVLADLEEPSTKQGYTFSMPYYYDNGTGDAYAFLTRQDDVQWSDLVFWLVTAIVYAEEKGITQNTARDMPAISLFGEDMKQIFRDCIKAVGSYGEIYNRTLESTIPRSGRNLLNEGTAQQYVAPFE
jgi:ABC-type amino acid transport substrate-binding protein